MILKNVWFAFSLLSYNLFIALPDLSHILVNLYCAKNILQIVCRNDNVYDDITHTFYICLLLVPLGYNNLEST